MIIEPKVFKDARGYFFESFSQREFEEKASKLYLYAHLQSDLNKKDVEKAALVQKCMVLLHI